MLWTLKKMFTNGTVINEIVSSTEPIVIYPKRDEIISSYASRFKYEIEHHLPPTIYKSDRDNKTYLVPMWIEVHPETKFEDVVWIKPKQKKVIEHIDGSMGKYKTTYNPNKNTYKCTCMGFWRSKGNCKHVKALKEKNLDTKVK
jgi:hypothetical protein